jgi:hypothetical protein
VVKSRGSGVLGSVVLVIFGQRGGGIMMFMVTEGIGLGCYPSLDLDGSEFSEMTCSRRFGVRNGQKTKRVISWMDVLTSGT